MTTDAITTNPGAPSIVRRLNPIVRRLLRIGLPMGDNALLTVRGRTSGQLRSFPVTPLETDGRRYIFAAFGETNWVRNLRAAGEATIKQGRRTQAVIAVEIAPDKAAPILQAGLAPVLKVKGFGSMIGGWYGVNAESTAADYAASARAHACFELRPKA